MAKIVCSKSGVIFNCEHMPTTLSSSNIPPTTILSQSVIFERIKTIPSQDRQLQITRLLDPFFTYRAHQKQQQKSLAQTQQGYDEGIKKIIPAALGD